ncbi:centrin, putative [Bodo saltans]|uniref:Centrin, putative n=1 Tax=Bodo saltans TaxID=75058 RepID=A0A0S4KL65_BODSA|nr:centrin, putative [Bodo saltans]|eukprot:CUI15326.1 centrin, putative [Bodo saltans]
MLTGDDVGRAFTIFDPLDKGYLVEEDAGLLIQALIGDLTAEELHATVKAMDVECNGRILRHDFERLVMRKSMEHSVTEDVWRSFLCLTRNGQKLDIATIRAFCETTRCVSMNDLDALVRHLATHDGSATITYETWKRVITALSQ